jgi:hypothetical protein
MIEPEWVVDNCKDIFWNLPSGIGRENSNIFCPVPGLPESEKRL